MIIIKALQMNFLITTNTTPVLIQNVLEGRFPLRNLIHVIIEFSLFFHKNERKGVKVTPVFTDASRHCSRSLILRIGSFALF